MTTVARVVLSLALAVGLAVILAGCSVRYACPAIGYINTATLHVKGAQPTALRVCAGDECAASNDELPQLLLSVAAVKAGTWTVRTGSRTPHRLDVTALDTASTTIATATTKLSWKRVGGSDYCGGPMAATATLDFR